MKTNNIQYGKYQHYKTNKLYDVIGIARHSETLEEMVIYKALYHCEKYGNDHVWVRPKDMFFEQVIHHGNSVPRFKWIND
jgi:hypothetical protein